MARQTALSPEERTHLGERVRHFRIQQNLTQAELAEMAGVSVTTLFHIETGDIVRLSSIEKVCWVGLKTPYDALLQTRGMRERETYVLYRNGTTAWYAPYDTRKVVPEDNAERLQDPAERRRLGKLGFVAAFHNNPNIVMPDGPGTLFLEVHGRMSGPINAGVYRDCKIQCQAGAARFMIEEETVELRTGDIVGCRDADLIWIEPLIEGEPALLLWMGAVRVGKAVKDEGRTIVRKPRRAE